MQKSVLQFFLALLTVIVASNLALGQQNATIVDKLVAEDGGQIFYARSTETGKRYQMRFENCTTWRGDFLVVVIEPGKGMGTYASNGGWCLITHMLPQQ